MQKLGHIIKGKTVNSIDKSIPTVNSNNSLPQSSQSSIPTQTDVVMRASVAAKEIAEKFNDLKSLYYYRRLIVEHGEDVIREAVSITEYANRRGEINRGKQFYFRGILRNWGLQIKFKDGG